jgi:hypothetical protein
MKVGLAKGLGALLVALMASTAPAQTIAITGGTVALGDGSDPIEGGTVVIRGGRIVAAGRGVAVPAGAQTVDATGKWVTPGIFAGFSRVGLAEVDAVGNANDVQAANSPFSAAIDVAPAVNPRAAAISISRANGVTRAVVAPATGKSIFAGQGAIIDLGSDMQPITRARAFQFVEMGEAGSNESGAAVRRPSACSVNALREARDSAAIPAFRGRGSSAARASDQRDFRWRKFRTTMLGSNVNRRRRAPYRFDAAALVAGAHGTPAPPRPCRAGQRHSSRCWASGASSRTCASFGRRTEGGHRRPLRAAGVPVIANALNDLPASFEQLAATQSNIARMRAAGVNVGMGMINDNEARQVRLSRQYAGNLVALSKVPAHRA